MIKVMGRRGGGGGDKSEHIYIEHKSNTRYEGVSIKINHSNDVYRRIYNFRIMK